MGIASTDFTGDGRSDLIVTNARGQLHAIYRAESERRANSRTPSPSSRRPTTPGSPGWGVSWADLDLDGKPELVIANGGIPVLNLRRNAQRIQVIAAEGKGGDYLDASKAFGLDPGPVVNGRGLAQADFDNDGDPDLAVGSIGGKLILLRDAQAHTGTGSGWRRHRSRPERRDLRRSTTAARSFVRFSSAAAISRPKTRGSSSGSGKATQVSEVVVRFPGGVERRLENVRRRRGRQVEK